MSKYGSEFTLKDIDVLLSKYTCFYHKTRNCFMIVIECNGLYFPGYSYMRDNTFSVRREAVCLVRGLIKKYRMDAKSPLFTKHTFKV